MIEYHVAFAKLQVIALVSLVERRIEGVHSTIKRLGSQMSNVTPPYMSALVPEPSLLPKLADDASFYNLCVSKWNAKQITDDILRLVVPSGLLQQITPLVTTKQFTSAL